MFSYRVCKTALLLAGILFLTAAGRAQSLERLMRPLDFETRRTSSSDPNAEGNGDARPIAPGATLAVADLEGPGVITHLWITVAAQDPFYGRSLVLRMYWDDSASPSVETPLGDFFGVGHGAHSALNSLPVAVSALGRARNCYWRMPFRKRARITVTNESKTQQVYAFFYYVDWEKHAALGGEIAYFHARYRQATPAAPGEYVLLDTTGRGHYAGTVYSAFAVERGWFGEGDDRFYIDGETSPSMRGTGTEDYFCDAWGFRRFSNPYYGVPVWEGDRAGDRVTAYRWHIADPVSFRKSLRVALEHKGQIVSEDGRFLDGYQERPDWVSSVAFWYQAPLAAPGPVLPEAEARIPPYRRVDAGALTARAEPAGAVEKRRDAIQFNTGRAGEWVEFAFEAPRDGSYQVNAALSMRASGQYQAVLDGQRLPAPLDLWMEDWAGFGVYALKAGPHTLRLECVGRSPNQKATLPDELGLTLDALYLLRMEDMAGYREVSKRLLAK